MRVPPLPECENTVRLLVLKLLPLGTSGVCVLPSTA